MSKNKKQALVLFVLGAPGTGKGTLSNLIAKNYGFVHLSAGALLREEIKQNSQDGILIKDIMDSGNLVPSRITVKLLLNQCKLKMAQGKNVFVIDGFPRNQENLDFWEKMGTKETKLMSVLVFECSEEIINERIMKRGEFSKRSDDNKKIMENRMLQFNKQSIPIIRHYEDLGIARKVKTDVEISESFKKVQEVIEELKSIYKW